MKNRATALQLACLFILVFSVGSTWAQQVQQGVVFKRGTALRVANARVYNERSKATSLSDNLGIFRILAAPGDTLQISQQGFIPRDFVVNTFADAVIYLPQSLELAEVTVTAQSVRQRLQEVEDDFRSKGIYYKGKPPLLLLLPFGGSPITFFYELLSKDGKRARRFHRYAEGELLYTEIASRFNNSTIKSIVPIKDEELTAFKTAYWPKTEQIRAWNDVDLLQYIKTSYQDFISKEKP